MFSEEMVIVELALQHGRVAQVNVLLPELDHLGWQSSAVVEPDVDLDQRWDHPTSPDDLSVHTKTRRDPFFVGLIVTATNHESAEALFDLAWSFVDRAAEVAHHRRTSDGPSYAWSERDRLITLSLYRESIIPGTSRTIAPWVKLTVESSAEVLV